MIGAITAQGSVTRSDVEILLNRSKNPAIALLNKLVEAGTIVKTGAARAVRYILPNQ